MTTPISISSEVARMRAHARGPTMAHPPYAEHCELRAFHAEERREIAIARLRSLVNVVAALSQEIALVERDLLVIAEALA